jgi:hypothetical protein
MTTQRAELGGTTNTGAAVNGGLSLIGYIICGRQMIQGYTPKLGVLNTVITHPSS